MRHLPPMPALIVLSVLLATACSSPSYGLRSGAPGDEIREFRETHIECNPNYYRTPCQIGPDGRLYRYNPGEKGYGDKN